jgi:hypothetical protein
VFTSRVAAATACSSKQLQRSLEHMQQHQLPDIQLQQQESTMGLCQLSAVSTTQQAADCTGAVPMRGRTPLHCLSSCSHQLGVHDSSSVGVKRGTCLKHTHTSTQQCQQSGRPCGGDRMWSAPRTYIQHSLAPHCPAANLRDRRSPRSPGRRSRWPPRRAGLCAGGREGRVTDTAAAAVRTPAGAQAVDAIST